MGKNAKTAKTEEQEKPGKAGAGRKGAAAASAAFRLPEPDRTVSLSALTVLPPPGPDGDEESEEYAPQDYMDALPRKLQLGHLPLLTHPVSISAIDNFLVEDECRRWIDWGERMGFEDFKQRATAEMAFRDNGRIEFHSPEVANLIWMRLKPFVPESIEGSGAKAPRRKAAGCSPRIRLYRYSKGQSFGQHVDGSRDEPSLGGRTHFTVLIYLNGGERDAQENRVKGGETVFWKDRGGNPTTVALAFPPTRGACLFHGHGEECMIHEGALVEDGRKYVLRTDAVYENEA